MELLVLNTNFESVAIVDTVESLLWTGRYSEYGDFEIYTQAKTELFDILKQDRYLWLGTSPHVMIIEDLQIKSDVENGDRLIVTGRSVESLLDRRIIWQPTVLTGSLQNGIQQLLNENIISPTDPNRAIPNFIFETSTDPAIISLVVDAQFTRTNNLYDSIKKLCVANSIGFRITLSETNQFIFKLFAGADRSYSQFANPYVVFSPKFDNIINSDYKESKRALKTVSLVGGEGEGDDITTTIVGGGSGLSRREMYTDASNLSWIVNGELVSEPEYLAQLAQRGLEDLSENAFTMDFDGQVDAKKMFVYGTDFFLGDIVQIANEYGIEARARVTEIIQTQTLSGSDMYPTFAMIEEQGEPV